MNIRILTTGGTIDKVYFDQKSAFEVGEPQVADILREVNVNFAYEVTALMRKDSLDMDDDDRQAVRAAVLATAQRHVVITHGTDTMVQTAQALAGIAGKVIVLTGALQPARFRQTDAVFNIAAALTAVQILGEGVYIAMSGVIFDPARVRKNVDQNRFEAI